MGMGELHQPHLTTFTHTQPEQTLTEGQSTHNRASLSPSSQGSPTGQYSYLHSS